MNVQEKLRRLTRAAPGTTPRTETRSEIQGTLPIAGASGGPSAPLAPRVATSAESSAATGVATGVASSVAPGVAPALTAPTAASPRPPERFLRRRTELALEHVHGSRRLSEVAALDVEQLARLGDAPATAAWAAGGDRAVDRVADRVPDGMARNVAGNVARGVADGVAGGAAGGVADGVVGGAGDSPVFFDTETTSLASGAGVYVFLIGFARVEGDRLVAEQLYLTDPGAEADMLRAASAWIAAAPLLVTFAGRGFDERRLEDRYRFLRLPSPFRTGRHADLCPLARSLWRTRLPSCALGILEGVKLGVRRRGDLPGEECPEAYFRSLRGDTAAREAVLAHNLADLLSTATLAVHALERAARSDDPAEVLGLGLHHLRRRRPEEALALLLRAEALEARAPRLLRDERVRLLLEAATLLRRAGREEEALRRWHALAEARPPSIDALLAIAKHAEHEQDDWDLAHRAASEALSLVRRCIARLTPARKRALEEDLVRRLARIAEKAGATEAARGSIVGG